MVRAVELNSDSSVTQVRGHGEVSNCGGSGNGGSDVVEDTSASVNSRTHGNEGDSCSAHHSSNSPVPVGTTSGDVDIRRSGIVEAVGVGSQRIIAFVELGGRHD